MYGIRIAIDTVTPKLRRMISAISPARQRDLLLQWGAVIANEARKTALGKGGRRFWRDMARSVRVERAGSADVAVNAYHPAAAQKQFGGVISAPGRRPGAKGAAALTIPISDESRDRSASEFEGAGLFRPTGTRILAIERGGELVPLFALAKSTRPQEPEPWFPDEDESLEHGTRLAMLMLERA